MKVITLIVIFVLIIGGAGMAYFWATGPGASPTPSPTPTTTPSPTGSPTPTPTPTATATATPTATPTPPPKPTATPTPTPTPPPAPPTVTDDLGRTVKLDKFPARIVSMAPSCTEILFGVGAGNRVVGVTSADDYPSEVKGIDKIGDAFGFDVEKIVSLKPDLVLMDAYFDPGGKWLSKLEEIKLIVVVIKAENLMGVLNSISLIGKVVGTDESARKLVESLASKMDQITAKAATIPAERRPRVLYVLPTFANQWEGGLWTAGFNTFADDLITRTGGINIANRKPGFFQMSWEATVFWDPQVIIIGESPKYPSDTPTALRNETRLFTSQAFKENRIYVFNSDLIDIPGPRIFDGLEQMARIIHPEIFAKTP